MALMAVAALALSGCSNSSDGNSDGASSTSQELPGSDYAKADRDAVQDGGTLRLAITAIPTSWNGDSALGNNVDLNTFMAPYIRPLNWIYGEDASFEPNPAYVTDYTMSDDGLDLTINLNEKAVWNDGTPITVDDYIATWKASNGTQEG